jgi:hypothetical protein
MLDTCPHPRCGHTGVGAHLVHEHRRDRGDGGRDQPKLTACISGKKSAVKLQLQHAAHRRRGK